MDRYLRTVVLNANGVRNKRSELHLFAINVDADVIILNEPHLKPDITFKMPAYTTYRTDRSGEARNKRGTAILIHRRVPHRQKQLPAPLLE